MTTPERGIRRARAATAAVGLAALGAIGLTSGLAYADTEHAAAASQTSTATDDTQSGTDQSGSDQSGTDQSDWGSAPSISSGSGSAHAQTNGS